jgi:L-alanine-DL-glutamate epimerase-like enolase superfamily enzyme
MRAEAPIERLEVAAYRIPTDEPEGDGTYAWSATTLVVVHASGGGARGLGYTYASEAAASVIRGQLAASVVGRSALSPEAAWNAMVAEVRNVGRAGIAATAISAVDAALWDLKGKLLGLPLVTLLGEVRESIPAYGSGGFTTYSISKLVSQLTGWAERGFSRVKMKVGASPEDDVARVSAASRALDGRAALMVDANGAYAQREALAKARAFGDLGVTWLEEPVSSDDLEGLRLVRSRAPAETSVAAGEYGYDPIYFRRMLESSAVDVLQADATRCLGITGLLAVARLCQAFMVPLSTHTAPSLHVHPACAVTPVVHVEHFHDHARIERLLFDGFVEPARGALRPDRSRPGLGIELKESFAARYAL